MLFRSVRTRDNAVVYTADDVSPVNQEWLVLDVPVDPVQGCCAPHCLAETVVVSGVKSSIVPEQQMHANGCTRSLVRGPCQIVPCNTALSQDVPYNQPGTAAPITTLRRSRSHSPPHNTHKRQCLQPVPTMFDCAASSVASSKIGRAHV